jgi:hypothetical protein
MEKMGKRDLFSVPCFFRVFPWPILMGCPPWNVGHPDVNRCNDSGRSKGANSHLPVDVAENRLSSGHRMLLPAGSAQSPELGLYWNGETI